MDFLVVNIDSNIDFELEEQADVEDLQVIDLGPAGIIPPDAQFNTVRVLIQSVVCQNGHLSIDRQFGEYVILTLRSDVTFFEILNWAGDPYFSRVILDIRNEGSYTIVWPEWIKWSRNRVPDVTDHGNDCVILTKAGVTVKGSIVGLDYPLG